MEDRKALTSSKAKAEATRRRFSADAEAAEVIFEGVDIDTPTGHRLVMESSLARHYLLWPRLRTSTSVSAEGIMSLYVARMVLGNLVFSDAWVVYGILSEVGQRRVISGGKLSLVE